MTSIQGAKRMLSRRLLGQHGISGVGIDDGPNGERIKVYLSEDSSEARALVPESIEGHPVVTEHVGRLQAFGA